MVAVVDPTAEFGIEIGAAAPAGMRGGFVQKYGATAVGKLDRRGKAGEPGADDMHATRAGRRRS